MPIWIKIDRNGPNQGHHQCLPAATSVTTQTTTPHNEASTQRIRKARPMRSLWTFGFAAMLAAALAAPTAAQTASTPTEATCRSYLATNANPSGIRSVSGPGVAQRSAVLAAGGKLVILANRYYLVHIPAAFYTRSVPVLILELPGTGGYPEAGWNDWHTAMDERGYAYISLHWDGGTPQAISDTQIYSDLRQIVTDVGAACPIAHASKWLMGFSVGSAFSFAVMIRDVAGPRMLRGQLAISGAAIGPLTTGRDVMHSTVESNRSNTSAVAGISSWMYCGDKDLDHGWSMCTEMPGGRDFVNTHGGSATLYSDPNGTHGSLPTNVAGRTEMFNHIEKIAATATATEADCLFNWAEDNLPALFAPKRPPSQASGTLRYRFYGGTSAYLGVSGDDTNLYYLPLPSTAPRAVMVSGAAALQVGCR